MSAFMYVGPAGAHLLGVVHGCCAGNASAWREFLPFLQQVGQVALRPFRLSTADREDIISDVLTTLFRGGLAGFRGSTARELVAFLHTSVRNRAIDFVDRRRREASLPADQLRDPPGAPRHGYQGPAGPDLLRDLAERDCLELLRREVQALPRYEQELFLMKGRGLKEREIAAQMEKPQGTVSADWLRLRRRLRERLRKAGCG